MQGGERRMYVEVERTDPICLRGHVGHGGGGDLEAKDGGQGEGGRPWVGM